MILAGYETGWLILWNIENRKPFIVVKNTFKSPLAQLKFWESMLHTAIGADSTGKVYLLTFKKTFFKY